MPEIYNRKSPQGTFENSKDFYKKPQSRPISLVLLLNLRHQMPPASRIIKFCWGSFILRVKLLFDIMKSRRSWSDKEDEAFSKLAKEYQPKNWAVIAKRLGIECGFKRRSGKQCRERWYNHLVPGISKKVWSKTEQEKLLSLHKTFGNKWTVIAEHMPGRTDNSIKNYFYSTVRRSLRRMGKLIGSKNSTSLMRSIKPSTLTHIFSVLTEDKPESFQQELKQEFQTLQNLKISCENVRDQIIQFSSYKPKRTDEVSEDEKKRYERVFQIILRLNDIYQRVKGFQRNSRSEDEIFRQGFKQMMKQASDDDLSQQDIPQSVSDQNSLEANPLLITMRTTRTRKIKIPEKLISILSSQKLPECRQADNSAVSKPEAIRVVAIQEDKVEPQMKIILNSPDFKHVIEEDEYSIPYFQIQLKDEVSNFQTANNNLNAYQRSPCFYFGTPFERVNFFKSPLPYSHQAHTFARGPVQEEAPVKDSQEGERDQERDAGI